MNLPLFISQELNIFPTQVNTVLSLLEEGNTIPFIARYRKERTNNLDEVILRKIQDRYLYLNELEERKQTILKSIEEQGKLNPNLQKLILDTTNKQSLEDLYLPYKRKRKTRADIAKEKGLEPLAQLIWEQKDVDSYSEEALQGARDIIAQWISEDLELKDKIREISWEQGILYSKVKKESEEQKTKFEMYYDYQEEIAQIPAHRVLAIRRGEKEEILHVSFDFPKDEILELIHVHCVTQPQKIHLHISQAIEDSYQRLIEPSIELEFRMKLKNNADDESITIFAENLKNLLLAPYGGEKMVLALDPGFRTGTKWVVLNTTGSPLEYGTIYPVAPQNKIETSENIFQNLLTKYPIEFICIGNGTASREVDGFVKQFLKSQNYEHVHTVIINESGASVYSASELAREEFPNLDVTIRGAVSIGRRFQDPLAELVKIDPKSIGVGQYQHDVNQRKLKKMLDESIESCVNHVGVNLNTASSALLSYVSGIPSTLAKNIITYRDQYGLFSERKELLKVPRFGKKAYEQSVGFLRIPNGKNPLDASAVHPESYSTVLKISKDVHLSIQELIEKPEVTRSIDFSKYATHEIGMLTLQDISNELIKPGRDPRKEYKNLELRSDIQEIKDLTEGLRLQGKITNITKFGVFVDIGIHQDGLVHISEISNSYIENPNEVCSVGDTVTVTVLSIELERKRISLSMKEGSSSSKKVKHHKRRLEKV